MRRILATVLSVVAIAVGCHLALPQQAQAAATDFVSTWTTTSAGESVTLPLYNGGSYNFTVNWGDGTDDSVTSWNDADITHTYAAAGTYTVTISGTITGWRFDYGGDRNKIRSITQWGTFNPGNAGSAFRGCEFLNITATDAPNLTGVTNLEQMFNDAKALTTPNFSTWNTSSVTNMQGMFRGATLFTGNVTTWNTGNVTQMQYMFNDARAFNQDLSAWNTSSVTNMDSMFRGATLFNGDITTWNTSNVTQMQYMFNNASAFNQNISRNGARWDTSRITSMEWMFGGATAFNGDISRWITSSVTNMHNTFNGAAAFNRDLVRDDSVWDTSRVTNMEGTFNGASAFNGDISNWNTSSVTTMYFMFAGASAFNRSLTRNDATGAWNTSNVNNMSNMFEAATVFNGNIGNWRTNGLTNMQNMFKNARAFNQNLIRDDSVWNTSLVTNMEGVFNDARSFNGDISNWNTSSATNMKQMFRHAEAFNQPIGSWNTSNVSDMDSMFEEAGVFNQPLNTWNTSSVTTMRQMFRYADAFNQPIGGWNTANVTNMDSMFEEAEAFNQPLNNWNTGRVTTMRQMFRWAERFNQPIDGWNTGSVTTMERMFNSARAFNQPLSSWNTGQVTNMNRMFEEAVAFNQPLGDWNTGSVTNMEHMFWYASSYNQSLAELEMTGLTSGLGEFMTRTAMTPLNVDVTLAGWAAQPLPTRAISLNLGSYGGSPGNGENNFYTQGSGSVAISALAGKTWAVTNGNFISTTESLPSPTSATMTADDSRTFDVLLKASAGHSYTYDSRSVLSATPTLSGSSAGAVGYSGSNGVFTFRYTASSTNGIGPIDDTIVLTVNNQAIATPILVTIRTVPGAPTITAGSGGDDSIGVAFTAPARDGGSAITNYEYQLDGGAWVALSPPSTSSPFAITGLTDGTTYAVKLRARNAIGAGAETAAFSVTAGLPPTAPTITAATPGPASAEIAFTPPLNPGSTPVSNYEYQLDGGAWVALSPPSTSSPFTIPGLTGGQTYAVALRAVNGSGPGPASASVNVTPLAPPAPPVPPANVPPGPPREVTAVPGDGQVTVSWRPPADEGSFPVTDYEVIAQPGGKSCLVKVPTLTCTITGLTNGTPYTFVVKALNGAGWGPTSEASSPVTPGPAVIRSLTLFQGTRVADGRHDRISTSGASTGLPTGVRLTPWIRYGASGGFTQGKATIIVAGDGTFTWTRQIRKDRTFTAWVSYEDVTSNRVVWRRIR